MDSTLYYVFIFNDNGTLKTDLITSENFTVNSILNSSLEFFIINNKKFSISKIYHFIDSYIDAQTILDNKNGLPEIYDQNNIIIDWNFLLSTLSLNHGINLIDNNIKLIILNKA